MNRSEVKKHFESIAEKYDSFLSRNKYYHKELNQFVTSIIPEGKSVLEIGSATGDLLNSIKSGTALGIDISQKMIDIAKKKYPKLNFLTKDLKELALNEKFDYIVMSNLLDYLPDILDEFLELKRFLHRDTRIIITTINPVWEPLIRLAGFLHLRTPDGPRNFVTINDVINLLHILDYEIIETGYRLFLPKWIPFISYFVNRILPRLPGLRSFCIMQYLIVKLRSSIFPVKKLSCSIIIPCYNESENIENCIKRITKIGIFTEIIVVDDGSTDNTKNIVENLMKSDRNITLISYSPNRGKGYAVKTGFDAAKGDVLIILDADMAVEPEELPRFFIPIEEGKADFINGTRMVYPRERESMKILNFIGNKFFGIILSLIMGQRNTDTLCGTKALRKQDYLFMKMGSCKWGDFDLLFNAAKLKLKMVEMPVHYKKRIAGKSKMKAFKHGLQLLRVCWKGLEEIP